MCGRFSLQLSAAELATLAGGIPDGFVEERRYNIAPGQWVIVIRPERREQKVAVPARWGLVPSWARDPEAGPKPINARAEGLAEKPSFRGAFRQGRCVIPASGFYEWKQVGKLKVPHYIRPRTGGIFRFAGLVADWQDQLITCAVITTTPNGVMAELHGRMPVILAPEAAEAWMDRDLSPAAALALLRPCPDAWLEAYEVGPEVGDVRNDHPGLIEPLPTLRP